MGINRHAVGVLLGIGTVILGLSQCTSSLQDQATSPWLNHGDSAKYVGMEVCASCHLDKAETFIHTGMGSSFGLAKPHKSAGEFAGHQVLYDSILDFYYRPYWRDSTLFLSEFRLRNGDTVHHRTEAISYIIGSGQHTNSHLIRKGDYVVQAPFTFYTQSGKLDLPPGFEGGHNSRFSRIIDQECMSCHNAMPEMKEGRRAFRTIGNGIDCERCHGPGSLHVDLRRAGEVPVGMDYTIVNPSRLEWDRQIDVCQRCHLQGNNVLKPGKNFQDFRPGMVLADVFEVYLPQYADGSGKFNMANHADRFQSSRCFIATKQSGTREFTCINCHNPHVSVKTLKSAHFNGVCASCHKPADCTETKAKRTTTEDNCVGCHMPVSGTEDIPHVTVHDHRIGVNPSGSGANEHHGEITGLYAVNNNNPEPLTLIRAYLTYYEKFDPLPIYHQRATELLKSHPEPSLFIHLFYQQEQWQKIVQLAEDRDVDYDAFTCYRIGKAYEKTNNLAKAVNWLELAILRSPARFEFGNDLGAVLIRQKKYDQAVDVLQTSLKRFPEYVPALNNLGFASIRLGEFSQADRVLTRARALDPDNINTLENLALLYERSAKKQALKLVLMEILRIDKNHASAKAMLSTLNQVQ
ncbi:MAG: tetratricopeptide repeat protein [Flavobacteriales bacterium]|nr:tetratricopeptide repeat protein [Bacteroidota bacterium]MCB9239497.1 tetratricopeptide repeat protein [Flavobacteriales bacterium]